MNARGAFQRWRVRGRCARRGHPIGLVRRTVDGVESAWCTCGLPITGDYALAGLPPRVLRRIESIRRQP